MIKNMFTSFIKKKKKKSSNKIYDIVHQLQPEKNSELTKLHIDDGPEEKRHEKLTE